MTCPADNLSGRPHDDFPTTSTSMLRAALAEEPSAWECLVRRYSPLIYHWIRRRGLQPADAADVLQEVLRSVAGSLPNFRREHSHHGFRRWLRRITQRRINDFFRSQARYFPAAGGSTAQGLLEQVPASDGAEGSRSRCAPGPLEPYAHLVQQVRGEFSERNWQIFWAVITQQQSTVEIARAFHVTPNVVRLAKSRILRRLKEALCECPYEWQHPSDASPLP